MAPRSSIFSYFYSEKPPEVKDGVAELPEPQDPQLFERAHKLMLAAVGPEDPKTKAILRNIQG